MFKKTSGLLVFAECGGYFISQLGHFGVEKSGAMDILKATN